jgi:hypothetical protein
MQMNPPWQNGGLSPIREVAIDRQSVHQWPHAAVAGQPAGRSRRRSARTAPRKSPRTSLPANCLPQQARDEQGLAAAAGGYRIRLAPGASDAVVVAFPLGTAAADTNGVLPSACA